MLEERLPVGPLIGAGGQQVVGGGQHVQVARGRGEDDQQDGAGDEDHPGQIDTVDSEGSKRKYMI